MAHVEKIKHSELHKQQLIGKSRQTAANADNQHMKLNGVMNLVMSQETSHTRPSSKRVTVNPPEGNI